jgi:pyocin large subunit-like protein
MPCQHTRGFISLLHRADHFQNHGARLGILTEEDYETFADEFLRNPSTALSLQIVRPRNGDLVRFDDTVDVFAVLSKDVKTCYRPDPAFHGEVSILDYYLSEAARE